MKKAAVYIRVSTQEQAQEGFSIPAQKERLLAFCKAKDWAVGDVFIDGGYSGSNLKRPAIEELIRRIKEFDVVLVFKLDRLSRSQRDTMYLLEQVFLPAGVDFVSMNESFDTSTTFGRAMVGILSVFAQLEREQIKERTALGARQKAKRGLWLGGAVPFGYHVNSEGRYVVAPDEAPQIRLLFDLYGSGEYSANSLAKELNRRGFSRSGASWTPAMVRRAIQNPSYVGTFHYDDIEVENAHEPIVSEESFRRAREVFSSRAVTTDKTFGIFTGFVRCGYCGRRLMAEVKKSNIYLFCNRYNRQIRCEQTAINEQLLLAMVDFQIRSFAVDESKLRQMIDEELGTPEPQNDSLLETEIAKADRKIRRLMDLFADDAIPADALSSAISELYEKRSALEAELLQTKNKKTADSQTLEVDALVSAASIWENADSAQRRYLLFSMLDEVILYTDCVWFRWSFLAEPIRIPR